MSRKDWTDEELGDRVVQINVRTSETVAGSLRQLVTADTSQNAIANFCLRLGVSILSAKALLPIPGKRQCFVCGCTDDHACETNGIPCGWVTPSLCTACVMLPIVSSAGGMDWLTEAIRQGVFGT